jgi:hypothetical protein
VVHGYQQRVFVLALTNEPATDERTLFEIERSATFLSDQSVEFVLCIGLLAQVVFEQLEVTILRANNSLYGPPMRMEERGAQSFMPGYNPVQGAAKGSSIKFAGQIQPDGNVISLTSAAHLRQEPEPLLAKGNRHFSTALVSDGG